MSRSSTNSNKVASANRSKETIENRAAYLEDLRREYDESYFNELNFDSLADKKVAAYLRKSVYVPLSHGDRLTFEAQVYKYGYIFSKTNNIVSSFKFSFQDYSCIYGFLYSRIIDGAVEHLYVCTGPTLVSQDGEYRGRVIPWAQFLAIFEENAEVYSQIEARIVSRLETGQMSYHVDFYVPDQFEHMRGAVERFVNDARLAIKFHVMCWVCDFYEIYIKTQPNHINEDYIKIIYREDDIPTLQSIIRDIGVHKYIKLKSQVTRLDLKTVVHKGVACGQKIIPVTSLEMTNVENIMYPFWRELYISTLASNLVLNLISPSFPVVGTWFYIMHTDAAVFDNEAMHMKYFHSDVAERIDTGIRAVDELNYNAETKNVLSNKFMRLSKSMHESIKYANENIKIVDTSIAVTIEYVGRTFRDSARLIAGRDTDLGAIRTFSDIRVFTKFMFEYIYGLSALNVKRGIIHCDLHLNNITVNHVFNYARLEDSPTTRGMLNHENHNLYVGYAIDAIGRTYVFPQYGVYATIIDFSRAVIGDKQNLEHEFGTLFTDVFLNDQLGRFVASVKKNLPWISDKYGDSIIKLIHNNFLLAFKILSAMDTYTLMYGIEAMLETDPLFRTSEKLKLHPGVIDVVRKLGLAAKNIILENIQLALDGAIKSPEDIEWPNLVIIRDEFVEYELGDAAMADPNIRPVDVFNFNNTIKHDFSDYQLWGPLVNANKQIHMSEKHKVEVDGDISRMMTFLNYDETNDINQLHDKYSKSDKNVLDVEDWMLE